MKVEIGGPSISFGGEETRGRRGREERGRGWGGRKGKLRRAGGPRKKYKKGKGKGPSAVDDGIRPRRVSLFPSQPTALLACLGVVVVLLRIRTSTTHFSPLVATAIHVTGRCSSSTLNKERSAVLPTPHTYITVA